MRRRFASDDQSVAPMMRLRIVPSRAITAVSGTPVAWYVLSIAWGDTLPHLADLDTAGMGVRVEPTQVKVRNRAPVDRVARPDSIPPSAPTP